ncbi:MULTISPECIES: serine/threonine-protein kinase [unclassified Mycobacterium]|uniref:serine/threonine-protein kinase n=1 Tax=unclassified Mycobacterium TaxID=2642494 RepID=UPI0007FC5BDF|nr:MULTISPECIES: serine/threonine-protein kinase [unclassified Mycobacterium]OBG66739.1 histidine kinase [Mycobacterium sp. E735]OBG72781.1 histidine kinase [Mycobacterium sp. E3305]OBG94599.1 histidine kinase [Mycobacterium sp. E3298]
MPLAVGTVIAGYRIEGVLGSGGMGTVYLARHPTLPRSDALKILSAELSVDHQFRVRFTREADLAATLNHPNIVRVYNRGETDDGHLWIAMEYVEGTAANDLDRANLTPARIVRIVTDVAAALDYAHSRRVLHRDIKPGNFLVAAPGSDHERVLLADFGIARALDDATTLTATGSMVGTAAYAAPETIEGRAADPRSDIYSLGCALFRLLTSRTPYEDNSLSAMLAGHLMRPVPHPTDVNPALPREIDDVIARALAKDPAERFQTAGALAAATAAALTGTPATRPGPTGPPASNAINPTSNATNPTVTYPPTVPPGLASAPGWPAYDPRGAAGPPHHAAPQQFAGMPPSLGGPHISPKAKRRKRTRLVVAAIVLVAALAAATVVGIHLFGGSGGGLGPYEPQTLATKFGTVKIQHRPMAVAALGPGDPDAVLSLGAQPVLMNAANATVPNWLQPLVHSSPPVFAAADTAAIAAAKPDLIIDTGDIDQPTYNALSAIAPTLAQPADNTGDWTWQAQLNWIATALGRTGTAKTLIDKAQSEQNTIRSEHGAFSGKSIVVVNYTGTATTAAVTPSPPSGYLESIGFTYNAYYKRSPGGPAQVPFDINDTDYLSQRSDVMLLLRTDPAAGGGGYAGLPARYSSFGGTLVIIDDPATIVALNSGGPAATTYLNSALVTKLANQIH